MNKVKGILNVSIIFFVVLIFVILSYFKFYTLQVSFSNDPTIAIVKTQNIQWGTNRYRIENKELNYNWYDEYGFKILYSDERRNSWQKIHSLIIGIWWVILIYFSFNFIRLLVRKFSGEMN